MSNNNPNKPFTGNFQLQTKIRVIIQEVLAATMRKLSVFNQKIDKFDDYFMIFKERVDGIEQIGIQNKNSTEKAHDNTYKLKTQFNSNFIPQPKNIKNQQNNQKNKIMLNEFKDQIQQMTKTIKNIQRQNQNLNNELSKTKGKFLQYSNIISALKEQVSWKITKYIQQTAQTNTQIKISNQQMKKQYFQIGLTVMKQKEKYEQIIMMNENHQINSKRTKEAIDDLVQENENRIQQNKKGLEKLDQYDTIMQAKLKGVQNKCNFRIEQLQKDNKKIMSSVKKLDEFNKQLQKLKENFQKSNHQMIKKLDDNNKIMKQNQQTEIIKLSKQLLKIEKTLQKKLSQTIEKQQKTQDFLTQKIQFIKMQIQNDLSSKTSQLLQEKQKSNQVNSSTMDQVSAKINKFNLQLHKSIVKVQNQIKQTKAQFKKTIQEINNVIQVRIQQTMEKGPRKNLSSGDEGGTKISPQVAQQLANLQQKFSEIDVNLQRNQKSIKQLLEYKQQQNKLKAQMVANINNHFSDQEEKISSKVQKIMFLITKMRGDGIIRNEFTDKQIKQLKKNLIQTKQYTDTLLKLQPAVGQCINLILSLVFDAEFQHSKIIQDNLPLLKKDEQRFKTCVQGILYQYKDKKKPNMICYRHKDFKKTDIIKSTFNAYIKLWEQLFQNQYKDKNHLFPKGFYKKYVQKAPYKATQSNQKGENNQRDKSLKKVSPDKNSKQALFNIGGVLPGGTQSFQEIIGFENYNKGLHNKMNKTLTQERQAEDLVNPLIEASNMNSSFRVGRKKTIKKDQILVINQDKDKLLNMNIVNIQP